MKSKIYGMVIGLFLIFLSATTMAAGETGHSSGRWSPEKAWTWYQQQPWPCGFNYVPGNAISYTEMWMDYSFDPKVIDAELKIAEQVGFNCLRIILPYVVWEHDPAAFNERLDVFLAICDKHGLKAMPIFFDDCQFGPITDPVYGKQPEMVEGWYANGWTPSPGHRMVRDSSTWPKLQQFVTDVIDTFKTDARILCWDLYNEPTNGGLGDVSVPLVEKVFEWARGINPDQPLTVGYWNENKKLNTVIFENSDVITFHNYRPAEHLSDQIKTLKTLGRPLICTEWLNRGIHSIVEACLPVFFEEQVGCLHWGLVNGKTQTDLNWGHQPGDPEPLVWQHDLYRPDFSPYSLTEIQLFEDCIKASPAYRQSDASKGIRFEQVVLTSELLPQSWRYTKQSPQGEWTAPGYDDSLWRLGNGGFGDPGIDALEIGTVWNSDQIWLRKEFMLDSTYLTKPYFRLFHDEEIWIYINGQPVLHRFGWTPGYIDLPLLHDKKGVFKIGKNVIAVRCRQTSGSQGVDVGVMNRRGLQSNTK